MHVAGPSCGLVLAWRKAKNDTTVYIMRRTSTLVNLFRYIGYLLDLYRLKTGMDRDFCFQSLMIRLFFASVNRDACECLTLF
jgi:hypothetical protein